MPGSQQCLLCFSTSVLYYCAALLPRNNSHLQGIRRTLTQWHTAISYLLKVRYGSLQKSRAPEVMETPRTSGICNPRKWNVLLFIKQGSWEQIHQTVISTDPIKLWLSVTEMELMFLLLSYHYNE